MCHVKVLVANSLYEQMHANVRPGAYEFMVDVLKWQVAIIICLFRLDKITFSLMITGNMRFLDTGRLPVTGPNNELSHGVGPVTTN